MPQKNLTVIDFLLDLQNQWIIGIIVFFILSMLFGMAFGYEPDWSFTVGWVVCGIFVLIFITQAFPDVWNFTFWLVGIYLMATLGIFSLLVFEPIYGIVVSIFGIFAEILGIGLAFYLILHFKNIRDEVSGITEGKSRSSDLLREGRYVPLGLWSLSIMSFWLCSNLSIWGWYKWAAEEFTIAFYVIMELLILFLGLYILWVPQINFRWSAAATGTSTLARPLKNIIVKRIPKTLLTTELAAISSCPICGHSLNTEIRYCPKCGTKREFYWCPRSEVFIKRCENCTKPVSFNLRQCPHCDHLLTPEVSCTKCGTSNRIRDWER